LKRFLDTGDRNRSTSGPTPWQIYDDDNITNEIQSNIITPNTNPILNTYFLQHNDTGWTKSFLVLSLATAAFCMTQLNPNSEVSKLLNSRTHKNFKTTVHNFHTKIDKLIYILCSWHVFWSYKNLL
jgi:hypothetical protein